MANWPCKHCNEVNANRNARLACLAYAYCFYKTANNVQVEQCLPPTTPTPLSSRSTAPAQMEWQLGTVAQCSIQAAHSAAQPQCLKPPCEVDYAINISICGLIFNTLLSWVWKGQGGTSTVLLRQSKWIVITLCDGVRGVCVIYLLPVLANTNEI